jgi:hypothetical protein
MYFRSLPAPEDDRVSLGEHSSTHTPRDDATAIDWPLELIAAIDGEP